MPIYKGKCYKSSEILNSRDIIINTGLFNVATPKVDTKVGSNNQVPVTFSLTERKHKTIKIGTNYTTDNGFSLSSSWVNRNFLFAAEELNFDSNANKNQQVVTLDFSKPCFLRNDQRLDLSLALKNSKYKAFNVVESSFYAGVLREFRQKFEGGIGGKTTLSKVKEKHQFGNNYVLVSIPFFLSLDRRDSVLNPTKGSYYKFYNEPFYNILHKNNNFIKSKLLVSSYMKLNTSDFPVVIALRGSIGSIISNKAAMIPSNEKYYSGGNNSVRGYGYQLAGPLDDKNSPIGGKSFLETTGELRFMRNDMLGFVIFFDSSVLNTKARINLNNKFYNSTGFGIRYNTQFSPIRADIAIPLKRRKGVDNNIRFYFGIGQSF